MPLGVAFTNIFNKFKVPMKKVNWELALQKFWVFFSQPAEFHQK